MKAHYFSVKWVLRAIFVEQCSIKKLKCFVLNLYARKCLHLVTFSFQRMNTYDIFVTSMPWAWTKGMHQTTFLNIVMIYIQNMDETRFRTYVRIFLQSLQIEMDRPFSQNWKYMNLCDKILGCLGNHTNIDI